MSYEANRVEKSTYELLKIQKQLDKTGQYYTYKKGSNITEIRTMDTLYALESTYNEVVKEFEVSTGLMNCKIDSIKYEEVTDFIREGVHFNQTIDFNLRECERHHMDMKRAYANFKLCKYYEGFVGKITDFRKCSKNRRNRILPNFQHQVQQ